MHNILYHMHCEGRAGYNRSSIPEQRTGRRVVNNVKTAGSTPYRIPAGKYDDARKSGAGPRRVLFSISVMHTIVTRIGTDCRSRRALTHRLANCIRVGTAADRLLSAASTVLTGKMKQSLGWMNKSNHPCPPTRNSDRHGHLAILNTCTHFNALTNRN